MVNELWVSVVLSVILATHSSIHLPLPRLFGGAHVAIINKTVTKYVRRGDQHPKHSHVTRTTIKFYDNHFGNQKLRSAFNCNPITRR